MYNEVIKLISVTAEQNLAGDIIEVPSEREVFAKLQSVGMQEFYQANANGFKPEIKFILADYLDYQGEGYVDYQAYNEEKPMRYAVIRTYRNGNQLEITCARGVDR